MHIDTFREYCLSKPSTEEDLPFGPETLVFKVCGKMFALCDITHFESVNLKCDPEYAVELRERYPDDVLPGYHMSKRHWNTVMSEGRVGDALMRKLIDHSYDLVVAGLPKSKRPKTDGPT